MTLSPKVFFPDFSFSSQLGRISPPCRATLNTQI
nr:MAG TPA: hypothetical protein [Caudoviricetes sp.]